MRDLNEHNITQAFLETIAGAKDERFKYLMGRLVQHMHDFVREVRLTEDEWMAAIEFLHQAGEISTPERSEFILTSDVLGVSSLVDLINHERAPAATENSVLGPFYIPGSKTLEVGGSTVGDNEGAPLLVEGTVCGVDGKPIAGALLDVWGNAAHGLYENQDPNQPESNLRFRMWTGKDGFYKFSTIKPVCYSIPTDGPVGPLMKKMGRHPMRPAHLHFRVSAEGYQFLTTELFESTDDYLDSDAVFGVRSSVVVPMKKIDSESEAKKHGLRAPFYAAHYDFKLERAA